MTTIKNQTKHREGLQAAIRLIGRALKRLESFGQLALEREYLNDVVVIRQNLRRAALLVRRTEIALREDPERE